MNDKRPEKLDNFKLQSQSEFSKINPSESGEQTEGTYSAWFFFVLLYLFVDYGRPQNLLPIEFLRPGMFSILILIFFLVSSNKLKFCNSKQTRLLSYFIALTYCYIPFARNNFLAFATAKSMLLYMPFILSTIIVVNSIKRLKIIINFIIVVMIYISLYSLYHHGRGTGGSFLDENDLCLFINTILPFCFFLFFYEKIKKKKILYAAGIIIGLLGIVESFSRGGFLGLMAMALVLWWFSPKKILTLIIVCQLSLLAFYVGGNKYKTEMSTSTDTEQGTGRQRIESWKAAGAMFLNNPLGVGGNNFQIRFPEYQTSYFKKGMYGRVAHSLWFTLLPELGIIGVFIYFSLLYYNLKDIFYLKALKQRYNENRDIQYLYYLSLSFLASFTGYFATATFLSVLYYPHYWYLTAILVVAKKIGSNLAARSNTNGMMEKLS